MDGDFILRMMGWVLGFEKNFFFGWVLDILWGSFLGVFVRRFFYAVGWEACHCCRSGIPCFGGAGCMGLGFDFYGEVGFVWV